MTVSQVLEKRFFPVAISMFLGEDGVFVKERLRMIYLLVLFFQTIAILWFFKEVVKPTWQPWFGRPLSIYGIGYLVGFVGALIVGSLEIIPPNDDYVFGPKTLGTAWAFYGSLLTIPVVLFVLFVDAVFAKTGTIKTAKRRSRTALLAITPLVTIVCSMVFGANEVAGMFCRDFPK